MTRKFRERSSQGREPGVGDEEEREPQLAHAGLSDMGKILSFVLGAVGKP